LGHPTAAREDLRKTLELARELAAADLHDILAQTDLAGTYLNLGDNEMQARDYEEAAKWIPQGIAVLQELEAQGRLKDQPVYQRWLAEGQHKLTVCRAAGRAIDDLGFVLAQPPPVAADLLVIRATALAHRGQHVAAAETAEKLRALDPKNTIYHYDAARCYGLCVPGVGQGKSPEQLASAEVATRKRYAARAIEFLTEAVRLGFQDMGKIETDADLVAIRQEEGYRKLMARLKAPPGKE
jgi:tetratricopeptide (TPR) repeat protein